MDKALGLMGLMKRAGALAIGAEHVGLALEQGRVRLLLFVTDTAENTAKPLRRTAEERGTIQFTLPYDKESLGQALGQKACAVCAVCEAGFAAALCRQLGQDETAETLQRRADRQRERRGRPKPGGKKRADANRGRECV